MSFRLVAFWGAIRVESKPEQDRKSLYCSLLFRYPGLNLMW